MSHELDEADGTSELGTAPTHPDAAEGEWIGEQPEDVLPYEDREGCELVDGVWVEKPMGNRAGAVASHLDQKLGPFVKANQLGFVMVHDAMFRLFPKRTKLIRKPDLAYVRSERFPDGKITDGALNFPPDLAVEVISPTDVAESVETKLDEYLRAGVRLVWMVYIPTRNVWAHKPDGTAKLYREVDTLPGEDVLPGFAVPVAELFQNV